MVGYVTDMVKSKKY